MRLLIHQENLYEYRIELLNQLGKFYDLFVLTSNDQLVSKEYNFKIIKGNRIVIGKFVFNLGVFKLIIYRFDKYILLSNLYYPLSIFFFFMIPKEKRILWGCETGKRNLGLMFRVLMMKLSKSLIVYNDWEKENLIKYNIDLNKIFVGNNTIHIPNASINFKAEKTSLIYVGRLQERKKIDLLLRAFSKLNASIRVRIKIEIIGDGDIKQNLIKLSESLNIDKSVIFHGAITNHVKLKRIFDRSYAYVSPDAIGLGLQHSFAYGVPVITSKDGYKGAEYYHLVDGKNCILWSANEKSLEDAIEQVLIKDINFSMSVNCFNYYKESLSVKIMVENFIKSIQYY
uniref:glycosyltransferase family 4 protein n=1 Tax=Flavobacterium sp. TaxID=239 RepID=UPI004049E684